jgi:hypothetical protein
MCVLTDVSIALRGERDGHSQPRGTMDRYSPSKRQET